ncbi:MAG: radical SAM protein [Myxococcales bacterium]|nr:radical SAM protein [Myxococcales bacterium]
MMAVASTSPLVFGPVPSRRLGQSLGINNIPPKSCTYSCLYCQVGATSGASAERRHFFAPDTLVESITARVAELRRDDGRVDVLTFVPSGEPTLDRHLGETILALKPLGLPIAVITNGSLLWRDDVRVELAGADIVSVKVDTVNPSTWHRINQPCPPLQLEEVLAGMKAFAAQYRGRLLTETMILAGVNDSDAELAGAAQFVEGLRPAVAYLAIPTRPPADPTVTAPSDETLAMAFDQFATRLPRVELLVGYDDQPFEVGEDVAASLLAIATVHPMRREEVAQILRDAAEPWSLVEDLVARGALAEVGHGGSTFYLRRRPEP